MFANSVKNFLSSYVKGTRGILSLGKILIVINLGRKVTNLPSKRNPVLRVDMQSLGVH